MYTKSPCTYAVFQSCQTKKKWYQRDWVFILRSHGLENSTFLLHLSIAVTCYNECHVFFCFLNLARWAGQTIKVPLVENHTTMRTSCSKSNRANMVNMQVLSAAYNLHKYWLIILMQLCVCTKKQPLVCFLKEHRQIIFLKFLYNN